ncbi:hypothetical protein L7F22_009295 [Adiantum nelumboides]|nr:hypothetical protein [Adiantum nelumboides]
MEDTNVRLVASLVVGVAATAFAIRQISGDQIQTFFSSSNTKEKRHILPSVKSKLFLWRKLELRSLQSLTYLLAAFGPKGYNAPNCAPGCMIASPSRPEDRPGGKDENENYFFQWPRDSALCLREVIRRAILAEQGRTIGVENENAIELHTIIRDFAKMSIKLQHTANRSGTFQTGGIGEPKFNVDGSSFEDDWGRPQNDGPALRAISMLFYANYLLSIDDKEALEYVRSTLYRPSAATTSSLIKDDLDYVARAWQENSYELWEEVQADVKNGGGHFHTLMVQRRALLAGAQFAVRSEIGDAWSAGRYRTAAKAITKHLETFWNPEGKLEREGGPQYEDGPLAIHWNDDRNLGKIPKKLLHKPHVIGTLERVHGQPKPCQVDVAVLLGFTHGWDGDLVGPEQGREDGEDESWSPWSDRALVTLDRIVDVFKIVYPINAKRSTSTGVLCGRYPEDVYDGVQQSIGHPWFLCTHAISEILSITAQHFAALPSLPIVVTKETQDFWTKVGNAAAGCQIETNIYDGTFKRGDPIYEQLMAGLWSMSDAYLAICDEYVGEADMMSEQIERTHGKMRGARELSWSYASFMSAIAARQGHFLGLRS